MNIFYYIYERWITFFDNIINPYYSTMIPEYELESGTYYD